MDAIMQRSNLPNCDLKFTARSESAPSDGLVEGIALVNGTLLEPLYQSEFSNLYLGNEHRAVMDKVFATRLLLIGPYGQRIKERLKAEKTPPALEEAKYLREATPKGTTILLEAQYRALKTDSGWRIETSSTLKEGKMNGSALSHFKGGEVVVLDTPNSAGQLKVLFDRQTAYEEKITTTYNAILEEDRKAREDRLAQLAPFFARGTHFEGKAIAQIVNEVHTLSLEITEVNASAQKFSALLRNDGLKPARKFQCQWDVSQDLANFTVTLISHGEEAQSGGGRFVGDPSDCNWVFKVDPKTGAVTHRNLIWHYLYQKQ
ncbi:MAG: hypothetical protein WC378_17980 [Opitutaceae bacterium]|jgi:hypothetical protein